jgi:hypothetical protein
MEAEIDLKDMALEELLADHSRMKKELGETHVLVQMLWAEIKDRRAKESGRP